MKIDTWLVESVCNTMIEMIEDRGYGVASRLKSVDELIPIFQEGGNIIANEITTVCIVTEKLGIKAIRDMEALATNSKHVFILTWQRPTPPAMKRLLNESTTSWCSQFLVSEVVRNITKHKLVPKHTKLSPSEMQKKLKRWNISNTALLPHILTSDPVARYLGLIDGDVVEIKGSFGTSNGTLHFRLATSG